jgi:clan AA aspartic protease
MTQETNTFRVGKATQPMSDKHLKPGTMEEIKEKIKLYNGVQYGMQLTGDLPEEKVSTHDMEAIVDTGAVMLALPQDVVDKLGLIELRTIVVRYADERREELPICGPVFMEIAERSMYTECIVLPPTSQALIGQTVLETLDLLADCQNQKLIPRPESPIYPMLNLK